MNFVLVEANTSTTNLGDYTKFISDLFYICLIVILFYCIVILGSKINWDFLTGRTKELIAKIKNDFAAKRQLKTTQSKTRASEYEVHEKFLK